MDIDLLNEIERRAMAGDVADIDMLVEFAGTVAADEPLDALCEAAHRVCRHHCGARIETCSIINARSGRCSEDCKWCAQSVHYGTGCDEYRFCREEDFAEGVETCRRRGVERYSMVTSGRRVTAADIKVYGDMMRRHATDGVEYCASMGLIGRDEIQALYDAGVRRYHCNLETAASYFPELCTTHTRADKLKTIGYAREVGMEVCIGGIIGMGETLRQRLELAAEARAAGAVSLPLNLLHPIKGTPLGDTPLLGEREIVLSAALMRFAAPDLVIRFAGGRARLSHAATVRMLTGGVNGVMVGDLLTTAGNSPEEDMEMFKELAAADTAVAQK